MADSPSSKPKTPGLTLVTQPQEFFYSLVTTSLQEQKLKVRPETEFYLVNLLNQFMTTDHLYPRDSNGQLKDEPLALLLRDAVEEIENENQKLLFRHVGDFSLYVGGFFQDSLNRRLVDVDYYIDMGETAYQNVAVRVAEEAVRNLYEELAQRFGAFVDVFANISEKTSIQSEANILRLYETWTRTRSERAAKALKKAGINPNETVISGRKTKQ